MNDFSYLPMLIDKKTIIEATKKDWNSKSSFDRKKKVRKYKHLFSEKVNWLVDFDNLNDFQQKLLIKSQIINLYNSLSSHEKTELMKIYELKNFSNKWHKLSFQDKSKILTYYGFD